MSNRRFRRALLCAAASVGLCSSAYSQTSTWTHAGNGTFSVAANWAGGVPGASSTALFSLNNIYAVTFTGNPVNNALRLTTGSVTLTSDSQARSYTLTSNCSLTTGGFLTLNGISLAAGAGLSCQTASIFMLSASFSVGSTVLSGAVITTIQSTFSSPGTNLIGMQSGAGASVNLQANSVGTLGLTDIGGSNPNVSGGLDVDGSSLTVGTLFVAGDNLAGDLGELTVSPTSGTSTVTQTGASSTTVGSPNQGIASVNIGAGGMFTSGTGTFLVDSTGSLNMTGGTLNLNSGTVIVNGVFQASNASINLASGQRFTIKNGGVASLSSAFTAPAGGTLTITGANSRMDLFDNPLFINSGATGSISTGGSITNCGSINIGTAGAGTSSLVVDGGTINGVGGFGNSVGLNGGAGRLTLLNGASVTLPDSLNVGGVGTNTFGLVTINSGTLTIGNLFIAATGGTNVTGEIDLTGPSASMALNGVATVGGSGAGTISVSSGTFDTGNGILMINNGGTVSVTGGSFGNNGAIFVDGSLTVDGSDYFASAASTLNVGITGVASFSNFTFLNGNNTVGGNAASLQTISASLNSGTLTANPGGTYIATNTLNLSGGVANINGGTFSLGGLANFDAGTFNFNAGTLIFTGFQQFDPPTATKVLGASRTVLPGRNLIFPGDCFLTSDLTVDGGNLAMGTLDSGGTLLSLKTGTFSLNSTTLTIGTNGQLGNTLTIGPNMTVNTHQANIRANGLLVINGGVFSASVETFVNPGGEVNLTNPSSTLGTTAPAFIVNNGGLIHGTGQVIGNVFNNSPGIIRASAGERLVFDGGFANSGTVSLLGGEIDSLTPSVNQNGGVITGRGSMLFHGLTNTATIALSAGLSDFTGTLTNNGTVIITGGGTATFYDTVANSPGSQFRVSTNCTAVFLGNVTGLSAFTGNGIKDFEGSASAGAIVTSGSSIVGGSTSLTADTIRENALTVIGTAQINANGTGAATSHLQSLTIDGTTDGWDGKLDIANNALVLDYSGASPVATVANQIKSAFHNGDWEGGGITSSLASNIAAHPTAIGFAEASALGLTSSFLGQPTDSTSVLIRYVFSGDANLDGVVNALDFNALATNLGNGSGEFWSQGDFNYDGSVNTSDFTAMSQNFGQVLSSPAIGVVVPEPSIVVWAALLACTLMRARRGR